MRGRAFVVLALLTACAPSSRPGTARTARAPAAHAPDARDASQNHQQRTAGSRGATTARVAATAVPFGPAERAAASIVGALRAIADAAAPAPAEPSPAGCDAQPVLALRAAVRAYLLAALEAGVTPGEQRAERIAEALLSPLNRAHTASAAPARPRVDLVAAERPPEAPHWLAVRADVTLPNGTVDPALYVFTHPRGAWQLTLADESGPLCADAEPARDEYSVTLVGAHERDGPYVLAMYAPADSIGAHRPAFEYSVIAIGADALAPRALLHARGLVLAFDGPLAELVGRDDGFDVRTGYERRTYCGPRRGWRGRECIQLDRYSTRGGRVQRETMSIERGSCQKYEDDTCH